MPTKRGTTNQRYRGVSAEARRRQRRKQLIRAAIAVYGQTGFRNASVKAICNAANLTERYFYESFPNSQTLLVAAFETITDDVLGCLREASTQAKQPGRVAAEALLTAFFGAFTADTAAARVFLIEIAGVSTETEAIRDQALTSFANLLEQAWGSEPTPSRRTLKEGVAGGLVHMATSWVSEGYIQPINELVSSGLLLSSTLLIEPFKSHVI